MSLVRRLPIDRPDAGFSILEVLIALAIIAVSIVAIGSVMSSNARGVKALENHLALIQTAKTLLVTAIPPRKQLVPGELSGKLNDYRWQIDIGPVTGSWARVAAGADVDWIPELVKIRVRSPGGASIDLETVRLMHRPQQ